MYPLLCKSSMSFLYKSRFHSFCFWPTEHTFGPYKSRRCVYFPSPFPGLAPLGQRRPIGVAACKGGSPGKPRISPVAFSQQTTYIQQNIFPAARQATAGFFTKEAARKGQPLGFPVCFILFFCSSPAKQPGRGCNQKANYHSKCSGYCKRNRRPLPAFCFFMNCHAGGRAGPMHQRKQHRAYCRYPGPSICHKQCVHLR